MTIITNKAGDIRIVALSMIKKRMQSELKGRDICLAAKFYLPFSLGSKKILE